MLTDRIEVVHDTVEESGRAIREKWRFWFDERHDALIVDRYYKDGRRPDSKRAWDRLALYDRLEWRDSTIKQPSDIPLPDRIVNEATSILVTRARQVRVMRQYGKEKA